MALPGATKDFEAILNGSLKVSATVQSNKAAHTISLCPVKTFLNNNKLIENFNHTAADKNEVLTTVKLVGTEELYKNIQFDDKNNSISELYEKFKPNTINKEQNYLINVSNRVKMNGTAYGKVKNEMNTKEHIKMIATDDKLQENDVSTTTVTHKVTRPKVLKNIESHDFLYDRLYDSSCPRMVCNFIIYYVIVYIMNSTA